MPKLPSRVTSRIPARKLCRQQQRPRLPGIRNHPTAAYFRIAAMHGLPLLKKMKYQAKAGRAVKALGNSRPMGESDPERVRDLTLKTRAHLDMLVKGLVPSGDEETHEYLCLVVGIAQIRICDIGLANKATGGIEVANELLLTLNAAAQGLLRAHQRHAESGCWGLDGPAIEALRGAIEIYEEVLRASSAQQMEHAQGARLRALQRQQAEKSGVAA
jgi:hypothetical protein